MLCVNCQGPVTEFYEYIYQFTFPYIFCCFECGELYWNERHSSEASMKS